MAGTLVVEEMSEDAVLEAATVCARTLQQAEVELLRVAYRWAVLHDPARPGVLDPDEVGKPGREQARRLGGAGTAEVAEFAAAELGARIGRTTHAAVALIADAQDLRHRHPQLWGRVLAGEVRASYARFVCTRTRELSAAEAAYVDAEVAESADGRIPWSRFEALVIGKVAAAAPALARAKEERARRATFAKIIGKPEHGMASFLIRAPIPVIAQLDTAITALAERLRERLPDDPHPADPMDQPAGEERPDTAATVVSGDERRVLAVLMLANPQTCATDPETDPGDLDIGALVPRAEVVVHLDGRSIGSDLPTIARLEGHGPVTTDWVRDVLGPHAVFTIRPVLDPLGHAPVDAYEIPQRHRRAVRLLSPADVFPFASCTSDTMQVDHTEPYRPHGRGGPSAIGNYGPLTQTHHRIKTFGHWRVRQPFPGVFVWRDPHGALYLVDHTGTRRVDHPTDQAA
ncbi:hypothetical protein I601_1031 [Nocardioides dokdonensis FR1436]|uniref:DUF222 domain-containing protein n=1 Tax=Nocardioides dokdonensis FR1436 TaxID=1300347 RepID=A0A1A9GIL9_9ACTN|nr:HNH endonuclease signature motif containing protein [Nocardioides dokdonensis]ANH37473.1 hypothetical protein I601_1031 [Nocardioides dokdonensis FR1436]